MLVFGYVIPGVAILLNKKLRVYARRSLQNYFLANIVYDYYRTLKRNKRKAHPRAGNVNSQDAIELKGRGVKSSNAVASNQGTISHDLIQADPEPDLIQADPEPDLIQADPEPDLIQADPEPDLIQADPEPDLIQADPEPDLIQADPKPDLIQAHPEPDLIQADPEPDLIQAHPEPDLIQADPEPDLIQADIIVHQDQELSLPGQILN
ncbi:coagulation factor V [Eurytemora carolleeae]|uniref:coagulation factor V n=1 Tax=Eurytemora carolleeae TaxID=1294199 RepID=UPI000C785813|nr:coagulation factor V [Eurytemora carolleeae]XP_023341548.1 coagulation factor V [Eurytemora carolleeae]XP_023341549.1 coagulation factor V [Eurytemora carolleeae]|eukprot:XP_023341547.1 coagulation factor V-like [Eurytemora affinis]